MCESKQMLASQQLCIGHLVFVEVYKENFTKPSQSNQTTLSQTESDL